MPKWDVLIELNFNVNNPLASTVKTNAKPELVRGIFETWLMEQIGLGKDDSEPEVKDKYQISIRIDLRDDTFVTTSDTGNSALTVGIMMTILKILRMIKIEPLDTPA